MASEAWLLAAERGESPALLAELDLDLDGGGDLRRYVSNFPAARELTIETGDQYLPFVHSEEQDSFGVFVDPKTYEVDATSEYTIWLSSDDDLSQDEVRALVALGGWEGKEVHFFIGFVGLLRADYEPIWGGVLEDVYSELGRVGFLIVGAQEALRTSEVNDLGTVTREHPFQIARRLIQEDGARLGDSLVSLTKFDPDNAVNVDIGHWGVVRAIHGGITKADRRVRDGAKVSGLLKELSMHTAFAWVPFENGEITPVDMSPGGTIGDTIVEGPDFAPSDYDQGTTTENLTTRYTALFSWMGSSGSAGGTQRGDPGSYDTGREASGREPSEFLHRFTRGNDDEAARWAHDNAAARRRFKDDTLEMKWVGAISGVDGAISDALGPGDVFFTRDGHVDSFAGRRKNGVEAGNWPLLTTRLAYFMIEGSAGIEIISIRAALEDTNVEFFDGPQNADTGDTIPNMTYARVRWTIHARAQFGTVNPGVPHPRGSNVIDITLAVRAIEAGINRFGRGAPIVSIKNLSLAHAFRPIGSVMGIVTDQYLAQATNGSDGTIAFKVIGKSVSLNNGVELLFVRDTTNVPLGDVVVVGKKKWWGQGDLIAVAMTDDLFMDDVSTSTAALSAASLNLTIGTAVYKDSSVFVDTPSRVLAVPDAKDTFVYFDAERVAYVRFTVATGGAEPIMSPFGYIIAKAIASGGAIISGGVIDLQEKVGLLGRLTKAFPGPIETTLPDPTSRSFDEAGQMVLYRPLGVNVGKTIRRWAVTSDEIVLADSPLFFLKMDLAGSTEPDESPNGNDFDDNSTGTPGSRTPAINDGGKSRNFTVSGEQFRITSVLGDLSVSTFTLETWINFTGDANPNTIFEIHDSGGSSELRIRFSTGTHKSSTLDIIINGTTYNSGAAAVKSTFQSGGWMLMHIVWTANVDVKIYANGKLLATIATTSGGGTTAFDADDVSIGSNITGLGNPMIGLLDNFVFYTSALNQNDINDRLRAGGMLDTRWEVISELETFSTVHMTLISDQTISTTALTKVALEVVRGSSGDAGADLGPRSRVTMGDVFADIFNNRVAIQKAGLYFLEAQVAPDRISTPTNASFNSFMRLNSTFDLSEGTASGAITTANPTVSLKWMGWLDVDDFIELFVASDDSDYDILAGTTANAFTYLRATKRRDFDIG